MRTPDFVLNEDFFFGPSNDQKVIPAGSFVRPIEFKYVPKETISRAGFFSKADSQFCYTRYGILIIPKILIRSIG